MEERRIPVRTYVTTTADFLASVTPHCQPRRRLGVKRQRFLPDGRFWPSKPLLYHRPRDARVTPVAARGRIASEQAALAGCGQAIKMGPGGQGSRLIHSHPTRALRNLDWAASGWRLPAIQPRAYFIPTPFLARGRYCDSTMAGGKKKAGDKKDAEPPKGGGGKPVKGAQSIFVRHILVRGGSRPFPRPDDGRFADGASRWTSMPRGSRSWRS